MTPLPVFAPGKIILSGEYAVIFGHPGVAVPVSAGVDVRYEPGDAEPMEIALRGHVGDERYARAVVEHCRHKGGPAAGRLTIENRVPVGKGMGSSTALVVAVCKCLLGDKAKTEAMLVEDTMNPGNSGLDFAVIWANRPVLFRKGKAAEAIDIPLDFLAECVLIDTGIPSESTPELVAWVREREADLRKPLAEIGRCTDRLLAGEPAPAVFHDHHRAQVALGVVPPRVQDLVREIERNDGSAKVVGAGGRTGGAGMVLAHHKHAAILRKLSEKFVMPCLPLSRP